VFTSAALIDRHHTGIRFCLSSMYGEPQDAEGPRRENQPTGPKGRVLVVSSSSACRNPGLFLDGDKTGFRSKHCPLRRNSSCCTTIAVSPLPGIAAPRGGSRSSGSKGTPFATVALRPYFLSIPEHRRARLFDHNTVLMHAHASLPALQLTCPTPSCTSCFPSSSSAGCPQPPSAT